MNRDRNEHPEWTDRLSDFMDGELDAATHARVEEHLSECGSCRQVLEGLREVKASARALGGVEPTRDLWSGIAATIEAPTPIRTAGATVIELPTAGARRTDGDVDLGPRRFTLSSRQLAAASIALIAISSVLTWAVAPSPRMAGEGGSSVDGVIQPVSTAPAAPAEMAEELATLERTVVEAREVLDPNTIRVLERNLGIIEQAIEDSRRALAQDPENDFLAEHLQRVYERKLEYLREAVRAAERSG